jgi:hypothetical protein
MYKQWYNDANCSTPVVDFDSGEEDTRFRAMLDSPTFVPDRYGSEGLDFGAATSAMTFATQIVRVSHSESATATFTVNV